MLLLVFQLVDGHTLFDYNVGLNEIIQILVQHKPTVMTVTTESAELTKDELELTEPESVRSALIEVPVLKISGKLQDSLTELVMDHP